MKTCEEYAALLDTYLDDECTDQERELVRQHLEHCPACTAYVKDCLAIRAAFPTLDDETVPETFAQSVLDALPAKKAVPIRKHVWLRAAVSFAACLLLVLCIRTVLPRYGNDGMARDTLESTEGTTAEAALEDTDERSADPAPKDNDEVVSGTSAPVNGSIEFGTGAAAQADGSSNSGDTFAREEESFGGSEKSTEVVEEPEETEPTESVSGGTASSVQSALPKSESATEDLYTADANEYQPEYFAELYLTEEEAGNLLDGYAPFDSNAETTMYQLTRAQYEQLLTQLDTVPEGDGGDTGNTSGTALVIVTHP